MTHIIEECDDCLAIFVVVGVNQPIRFNALLTLCKEKINPKYSAPRLNRHLKALEGILVEKTQKKPQNISYSIIAPELSMEVIKNLKNQVTDYGKMQLEKLVDAYIKNYGLSALSELIFQMVNFLKPKMSQRERVHSKIDLFLAQSILRERMKLLKTAMKDHNSAEYQRVLANLKNERNGLR